MRESEAGGRYPSEIDVAVGKRLELFRHSQDLSQKVVAKYLGISSQQLQKYEKGINRISAGRLWQVSQFFGVTPNQFYEDSLEGNDSLVDANTFPKVAPL